MQQMLRFFVLAIAAAGVVSHFGLAAAQAQVKQLKLTEKQVEGFIAAHKDIAAAAEKMPSDKPDPAIEAQLEVIAKKFGFKDFNEYDEVAFNIHLVMDGIDPQTKSFTEPPVVIKKRIDDVKGDKSMSEAEKKEALDGLNEALKTAQPVQFPANVELIKKYFNKIQDVLQ